MIANGSFNWTRQAVLFNQENVVLSDNPALVRPSAAVIRHDANFFCHKTTDNPLHSQLGVLECWPQLPFAEAPCVRQVCVPCRV